MQMKNDHFYVKGVLHTQAFHTNWIQLPTSPLGRCVTLDILFGSEFPHVLNGVHIIHSAGLLRGFNQIISVMCSAHCAVQ